MAVKMPSKYEIIINNQRGANQGQGTVARRVRQTSMASNTPKSVFNLRNAERTNKLAFNLWKVYASRIGDLTGNRVLQRNVNTTMRWIGTGLLAVSNPAMAAIAAVSTVASNALGYHVDAFRSRTEKDIYRHISGNTETSGSRYGGRKR